MRINILTILSIPTIALSIAQCGLPSNEFIEDLNTPKLLAAERSGDGIKVSFVAYNPESNFSGYNIYIADDTYTLENALNNHINYDNSVNTQVESYNIIKNEASNNIPTIQDSDPDANVTQARTTPTEINYIFTKQPNGEKLISTYYIAVTAYSTLSHTESALSEIIQTP